VFYSVFVLAVTVHAPIGLRSVLQEWFGWRTASRDVFVLGLAMLLAVLGMRAAFGVFL
jgi:fumarate reductase subunit C